MGFDSVYKKDEHGNLFVCRQLLLFDESLAFLIFFFKAMESAIICLKYQVYEVVLFVYLVSGKGCV